ncbi:MAG TPA: ISAs1 family transposase [Candidatus Berkiella sp.]|nr:ISAs1 family transposase [Candidatus Berkiella sp.]
MLTADFLNHFSKLEDPRVTNHNTRHKFIDILVLGFVGILCGCNDWEDVVDFAEIKIYLFKDILELPHGIPSHDTFSRVFSMIDGYHFEEIFIEWMKEVYTKTNGEIVSLDGKTIRGARAKGSLKGAHIVSAWACKNQLTLGAMKVDCKENEITVIPRLLKLLNIAHCTVTIDAMGCQKKIAEQIIEKKANYVLTVKGNQKELRTDIETVFSIVESRQHVECLESGEEIEKKHGRKETRRYTSLPIDEFTSLFSAWVGIKSITRVIRKRELDEKISDETVYFISSHPYHSEQIKTAIRSHWHIENRLHWQLDVSFNEDRNRSRIKNEAQNIALIRRLTMNYLKKETTRKASIKRKRKQMGWDDSYFFQVLSLVFSQQISSTACEK